MNITQKLNEKKSFLFAQIFIIIDAFYTQGSGFQTGVISLWLKEFPFTFLVMQVCYINEFSSFCLHSWMICLWHIRNPGWSLFSFSTWKMFHCLLASIVSDERLAANWTILLSFFFGLDVSDLLFISGFQQFACEAPWLTFFVFILLGVGWMSWVY